MDLIILQSLQLSYSEYADFEIAPLLMVGLVKQLSLVMVSCVGTEGQPYL